MYKIRYFRLGSNLAVSFIISYAFSYYYQDFKDIAPQEQEQQEPSVEHVHPPGSNI